MDINNIISAIRNNRIRITDHADEEAENDQLTFDEIYFSVLNGDVIEDYPDDKPYPSCLIYGQNFSGDPIHSVWAFNEQTQWAVLITVYRPDPTRWINWRKRRK
jgi:hypothetical protein